MIIIYMCIAPGWGQMNPMVPIVYRLIDIQSYCPFHARFSFRLKKNNVVIPISLQEKIGSVGR